MEITTLSDVFRLKAPSVEQLRDWKLCCEKALARRDFPYFHVEQTTRLDLSRELLLGVKSSGIWLVKLGLYDPGREEEIAHFKFEEIYSWGASDNETFEFRVASERTPYLFKTMDATDINKQLDARFNVWQKSRPGNERQRSAAASTIAASSTMSAQSQQPAASMEQEAAKAQAAKQEAAKQEAAKQEAAKQEAAKQEAAKQEAERDLSVSIPEFGAPGIPSVPYTDLAVGRDVGSGSFKQVFKATWSRKEIGPVDVAVLALRSDIGDMKRELKVFAELGKHHHLTRLLALTTNPEGRMCLVTEFASWGSLDKVIGDYAEKEQNVDKAVLVSVATQVCEGMRAMQLHRMIHRDLASRNVLVFEFHPTMARNVCVKISDYGLSVQKGYAAGYVESGFSTRGGGRGPVRWSAPEVLMSTRFSEKSDVWAFGVLLWEIWSECQLSFFQISNDDDVIQHVCVDKMVLKRPVGSCGDDVYELMVKCWAYKAKDRPSFDEIKEQLDVCRAVCLTEANTNESGKKELCVVCLEQEVTHAAVPCGHACVCSECSSVLQADSSVCPICRGNDTSSFMRIFQAGVV